MRSFIQIDNEMLINKESFNTFNKIETEGFTLYCYLLTQQGQRAYSQVTIKMIINFMTRDVKNPKELKYSANKVCKISATRSKNIIIKYLDLLNTYELIEMNNTIKYGLNDIITIKTKKVDDEKIKINGFTMISEDLFVDYIHKIGHIGWSLLYILTNLFNYTYGNISCEGFAKPSEEYLKSIIKKDVKTISVYLYLLQEYKLITIEKK